MTRFETIVFAALVGVACVSCSSGVTPGDDCRQCPPIPDDPFGNNIPRGADTDPRVSMNGTFLSYGLGSSYRYIIQRLSDGSSFEVDMTPFLRPKEKIYVYSIQSWCPYDDNLALVSVKSHNARADNDSITNVGTHLFIYNVSARTAKRITPSVFGDTTVFYPAVYWSPNSTIGNDIIRFNGAPRQSGTPDRVYPSLYYVQSDSVVYDVSGTDIYEGPNGGLLTENNKVSPPIWTLNGKKTDNHGNHILRVSWSPSGRYVAITPTPQYRFGSCGGFEIWIYCVDEKDATDPCFVISLLKRYCLYSSWEPQANFLTDTTLLINAHELGAVWSFLYEVRFDGTIVRQVTKPF
jgi:hypothetical protein